MPAMHVAHGKMAAWLGSLLKATSLQARAAGPNSNFRALMISRGGSRVRGGAGSGQEEMNKRLVFAHRLFAHC